MTKRHYEIDVHAVRALYLEMSNDGRLYEQRIKPIIDNLQRKMNKRIYSREKAIVLVNYAVTDYERKHGIEICGIRLNVAERYAVAKMLLDTIESRIKI